MSIASAFDNRSLRAKMSAAMLAAIISGLVVGGVAIYTVRRLNTDAEAAQRQIIAVESTVDTFGKNVEAFSGGVSAAQLYPASPLRSTRDSRLTGKPFPTH